MPYMHGCASLTRVRLPAFLYRGVAPPIGSAVHGSEEHSEVTPVLKSQLVLNMIDLPVH